MLLIDKYVIQPNMLYIDKYNVHTKYLVGDVSMLVMCSYARTAQMIIFDVFLTQCFPVERKKKKIAKSQNRLNNFATRNKWIIIIYYPWQN